MKDAAKRKAANAVRDRALERCANPERARRAWRKLVADHPAASGKQFAAARLAMLTVLADGGTIEAGDGAAREALS